MKGILLNGYVHIDRRELVSNKNPDGRIRYYVFATIDGVKKPHGAFDYWKDARARKRVLEGQIANGTYGQQERKLQLFSDYYQDWWQGKSLSLRPASQRAYSSSFEHYLLPYFGKLRIDDISPQNVQEFIGTLKRLSPRYVRTIYSHLRVMLNTAVKRHDIAVTPCIDIDLPGIQRADLHYLEPSEVWLFIDSMGWPYKALYGILGLTGIRVGEALALRMKHVDLLRKEISVEEAWDINARVFHEPKTKAGLRKVGILSPLAELLQQYFDHYPMKDRNSLLFPSPTKPGQPVSYNTIHGVFKRHLKKADLPKVTTHSLRHSFASAMLSVGVSVNTLARYLGHSSPDITYRIYAHEISENLENGLERASQLFGTERATNIIELDEWRKSQ